MPTNFYKIGGNYYDANTNNRIADVNTLQSSSYAGGGGKLTNAPTSGQYSEAGRNALSAFNTGGLEAMSKSLYQSSVKPVISSNNLAQSNASAYKAAVQQNDVIKQDIASQIPQTDWTAFNQGLTDLVTRVRGGMTDSSALNNQISQANTNRTTAQTNLANKQNELRNFDTSTTSGQLALEGQGRGMTASLVSGQQEKLGRQRALDRQSLASEEANMIDLYNIANQNLTELKNQQQNNTATDLQLFQLQQNAQQAIQQQKQWVYQQALALRQDQQNALANILNGMAGLNPDTLTAKQTGELYSLAQASGVPYDLAIAGLKAKYQDYQANQATQSMDLKYKQAQINQINNGKQPTPADRLNAMSMGYEYDNNGNLVKKGTGIVTDPTGQSYDISSYATDPNHEKKVQNIISGMGQFKSAADIDAYIKSVAPNSPITGQMVINASNKYGGDVSWETITAMMLQDSSLGTKGKGARTFNPGNVGNDDSGNIVNYGSWQKGVDAVAGWLDRHRANVSDTSKFTPEFYNTDIGQKTLNNEQQYQTNFMSQPLVKDFITVQNKAGSAANIINLGVGGPGDLALVYEFMKALDPTSVVRETEYDSAAKSGNIFSGWAARFNGYLKEEGGMLPDQVKGAFLDIMKTKLKTYQKQYDNLREQYRKTAKEQGLNPDHVAPNLTIDFGSNSGGITLAEKQLSDEEAYQEYLKAQKQ